MEPAIDSEYTTAHAARDFVRMDKVYQESTEPVYDRWTDVLIHVPEARTRGIAGRYDDVYIAAFMSRGSTDPVSAWGSTRLRKGALELAMLQGRFFEMLLLNKIGHRHAAFYRLESVMAWWRRLDDKLIETMPAGFTEDGKYLPEIMPTIRAHDWQN